DVDKEYFDLYYYIKLGLPDYKGKGIISLKKRRGGLSEKFAKGVLDHGMRFSLERWTGGLCAGLDDYVEDMRIKFREVNSLIPPELRIRYKLSDTDEIVTAGWKNEDGDPEGSRNTMHFRTMFNNPNVFKGKFFDVVGFEEGGEFKYLNKGFSATAAGMKVGLDLVGVPFVYGTSGKSGSKDFRDMWHDADAYNLIRAPIWGPRMMISGFVGSTGVNGKVHEITPNIDRMQEELGLSREQVLGCEDIEKNTERIIERRKELQKANNRELYLESFLDFPLNEREALMNVASNHFDKEALAQQRFFLMQQKYPLYGRYVLEWAKNADNTIDLNKVHLREATDRDQEGEVVYIRKDCLTSLHTLGYKRAYAAGIDSYDQDNSMTSKSLGAMVVFARKGHPYKNIEGQSVGNKRIPVLIIRNRPRRKETFYDNCLKASVYFGIVGMVMVDAHKPMVMEHFKNNGGRRFLAKRPLSFESDESEQRHDFGIMMTQSPKSKPQALSMLQTYVLDEIDECYFDIAIEELSGYDELVTDSDFDLVDAMLCGIACDIDMKLAKVQKPTDKPVMEQQWVYNQQSGTYQLKQVAVYPSSKDDEQDKEQRFKDPFMEMLRSGAFQ
ncbi:MAG TPA: hypothetical protein PLI08_06425, partial [Bacteroidia bacterium]|nr:hypothetical protein [Bacteroidia bacterium]